MRNARLLNAPSLQDAPGVHSGRMRHDVSPLISRYVSAYCEIQRILPANPNDRLGAPLTFTSVSHCQLLGSEESRENAYEVIA